MSKINVNQLQDAIELIFAQANGEQGGKKRKFPETVDLLVNLKNYDPSRDKRFAGTVRLPFVAKPRMKVCLIADQAHKDTVEKKGIKIDVNDQDHLKSFNKQKKVVKKYCGQYDAFLASDSLIKNIPKIVGPLMNRCGKFPTGVGQGDDINEEMNKLKCNIKFQLKKVLCLGVAVGHCDMKPEELRVNITLAINFLVSLLKKNWQNLKSVYIKTTMGKPIRIF
jgi:large subunit ribosomal protein L10Ae